MKRSLYILALTTGLAQAAATDTFQPIVIAAPPASVINNMIRESVALSSPESLASPVGQLYVAISDSPEGINSLGQNHAVVTQTNIYNNSIQANKTLQILTAHVMQLVKIGGSEARRVAALTDLGSEYGTLLKKLVQADVPNLELYRNLELTIETDTNITLDSQQKICVQAAQLAGALNKNNQFNIDPTTFEKMYHHYLVLSDEASEHTPSMHPILTLDSDEEIPACGAEASTQDEPKKSWWPFW